MTGNNERPDLYEGAAFTLVLARDLKRTQIVQYAGASGDFNPLHTDEPYATQVAGYRSVFAHGMLTMGMTGRLLVDLVGTEYLRSFGGRFISQVWPGDTLVAQAVVERVTEQNSEATVEFAITTTNQRNEPVFNGSAIAILPLKKDHSFQLRN